MNGAATKAFLCNDLVGQQYLAYLVPVRVILVLIKINLTNDNNLIFGTSYCIIAKDAVPIPVSYQRLSYQSLIMLINIYLN